MSDIVRTIARRRARLAEALTRGRARLAEALARRRVTLGFVFAAIAFWFAEPTTRTLGIGSVIMVAGEAVRVWAAGHLEKGREVTTSGPYRFTRHPLYFGSTVIGLGFAVAANDIVAEMLVVTYLLATLMAAMRTEEAHLTDKFGSAYPAYREGRAMPASRRFSFERAVRNREYRAVMGLVAALALLAWKAL